MAMLAEKKRRTQWCLNPMGNFWAKDENKFGQKMLEKMGWSPGMGLGANCQGNTEIIKMNVKNDTLGLGSKKENQKEMWTKQLVDFDSLLSELNGTTNKDEKEPVNIQSLEDKSKSSRVRVHYHKFTRGKDVSKYSTKDLNCILPLNQVQEMEKEESPQNNMYAYFGKKANNPYKQLDNNTNSEDLSQEEILCEEEEPPIDSSHKDNVKKKRKKHKHLDLEQKNALDDTQVPELPEESVLKKKKKKRKQQPANEERNVLEQSDDVNEDIVNHDTTKGESHDKNMLPYENECSDHIPMKKKKKKKNKQKIEDS